MSTSILANYSRFKEASESSSNIKEFLISLGLRAAGGNYKQAHYWSKIHGIALPKHEPKIYFPIRRFRDEDVFVENSTYANRGNIKKRLLDLGWKYECSTPKCAVSTVWLGLPISLHLDHINGIFNDNRLENLRFLCPNCHTQTDTYAGKKIAVAPTKSVRAKKIVWPTDTEVSKLVEEHGYRGASRILGVSDNAIRKHLKLSE